jgi:drug/metabolite transporter (DMT)-like permease
MSALAIAAALGAATAWAVASALAHAPAKSLGAFAFTRIQLVAAAILLAAIATARGAWATVAWDHWPALAFSAVVGVLLGNLALIACLRRGGPRRTLLLLAMNAPIAALLGYGLGGETASAQSLIGGVSTVCGVMVAVLYGRKPEGDADAIHGSLWFVVFLGLAAATCHAVGLVALKPAMLAGTDPVAASALRIAGSAAVIAAVALLPVRAFAPVTKPTIELVVRTIAPGLLGYVLAATLLLYAVRDNNSGLAIALGSTSPVMILPIIWITTGTRPRLAAWVAAGLVVTGTVLISTG